MVVVGCGNGTVGFEFYFEFLFYYIVGFFLSYFNVL